MRQITPSQAEEAKERPCPELFGFRCVRTGIFKERVEGRKPKTNVIVDL